MTLIYVQRACRILSVTPSYIYALIREGKIAAVKIGERGIRPVLESVEAYKRGNIIRPDEFFK